jgi:Flp pilus assembly protein TadB
MAAMSFVAFLGLVGGAFMAIGISPFKFAEDIALLFRGRKRTLAQKIGDATRTKQIRGIRRIIMETKAILEAMGKPNLFGTLNVASFILFVVGTFFSLMMSNFLMIPVLAAGLSILPFWYVLFTANFYKKQLNAELETSLSIITTAYLRTENFIMAVEENVRYLNPPVREVFQAFLAQATFINSDIRVALNQAKHRIAHDTYREWIDAVLACQDDKTLKSTLTPIIAKLSDMRLVSADLDLLLYEPLKEFVMLAILLVGNIAIIYFLSKEWFDTLIHSGAGKAVLAISAALLFISLSAVVHLTRPIEYKR